MLSLSSPFNVLTGQPFSSIQTKIVQRSKGDREANQKSQKEIKMDLEKEEMFMYVDMDKSQ